MKTFTLISREKSCPAPNNQSATIGLLAFFLIELYNLSLILEINISLPGVHQTYILQRFPFHSKVLISLLLNQIQCGICYWNMRSTLCGFGFQPARTEAFEVHVIDSLNGCLRRSLNMYKPWLALLNFSDLTVNGEFDTFFLLHTYRGA